MVRKRDAAIEKLAKKNSVEAAALLKLAPNKNNSNNNNNTDNNNSHNNNNSHACCGAVSPADLVAPGAHVLGAHALRRRRCVGEEQRCPLLLLLVIVNACARRIGSRAGPEHAVCGDDASRPTGASQWVEGLVRGKKQAYRQDGAGEGGFRAF